MSENAKYRVLQGSYWMLFCAGYGYVTYMLMEGGYAVGEIGVLTAAFGVLAAVLQTVLGRLADRGVCGGWRGLLLVLAGGMLCVAALLCFLRRAPALGLLYGLLLMGISSMMPLINAASFHYQSRGVTIDFGKARGIGSLCYAVVSLVLGRLTAAFGVLPVPVAALAATGLFALVTVSMPYDKAAVAPPAHRQGGNGKTNFAVRYPRFCLMLAGSVLLLAFHNITNTYLIQMLAEVGGDSGALGTALAIAALMELPVMFGFTLLHKRCPAGRLLLVAGLAFTAKAAVFLLTHSVAAIYAAQVLQMFSFALFASASVYYAEESMAPADKVSGQALMSSTITAGAVVGNLLGGWVLAAGGVPAMLWLAFGFAAAGTLLVLAAQRGGKPCKGYMTAL